MAKLAFRGQQMHPELADRLAEQPRLLIFDFDGTLSPIAPTPEQAKLPTRTKSLLQALAAEDHTRLAFVSGRSLPNLRAKIGLKKAAYVGNHGLTADPPELGFESKKRRQWFATALKAYNLLKPLTDRFRGSHLEFKGPDLSLHYRRLPSEHVEPLLRAARSTVRKLPLAARDGKQVLELRPATSRNKGWAVNRLICKLLPGWRTRGLCLYLGDDATDEDAFSLLRNLGPRAVGIKVGVGPTLAHFRLRDPEEVVHFLWTLLCGMENAHAARRLRQGG